VEGAVVVAGSTGVLALFGLLAPPAWGTLAALMVMVLAGFWMLVWGLAWVLRVTASQSITFMVLAGLGFLVLLGIYLVTDSPAEWWGMKLQEVLRVLTGSEASLDPQAREQLAAIVTNEELHRRMTGTLVGSVMLSVAIAVGVARWWQALLFNPGGFGKEFRELRLGRGFALVTLVILVGGALMGDALGSFVPDALAFAVPVLLIPGLAVVHGAVAISGASVGWLVGLYVLLILPVGPLLAKLLSIVGLVDPWLDLRGRLQATRS
jgi:hypothetical protein